VTQIILSWLNEFSTGLYYAAAVVVPLLHVFLAAGVLNDCRQLAARGRRTELVPAVVWTVAVLTTGLLGLAVYWLVHHSTLRPENPTRDASER
jgi:hypothetical protein